MSFSDIKKYFFGKLVFTRVLDTERPGIIISKNFNKVSRRAHKMRIVYTFEDFYLNLHKDTLKKLGLKKTNAISYEIGKDIGIRYFLFNGAEGFPFNKISMGLKFFQEISKAVGMGFCKRIDYDSNKKVFVFEGDKNIICRKTANSYYISGIIAGVVSFLMKENFEAKSFCSNCPHSCKIVVSSDNSKKYFPNLKFLAINKNYGLNFQELNRVNSGLYSLSDFIKFKFINIDDENKFHFGKYYLMPSEMSLVEIIAKRYLDLGEGELFVKSVSNFVKGFCEENMRDLMKPEDKIKMFRNIVSAFGWGEIYIKKDHDFIKVKFLNPLFSEFGLIYLKSFIKGFLDYFYRGEFSFDIDEPNIPKRDLFFMYKKI